MNYRELLDLNNLHQAFVNCQRATNWKASVQSYEAQELHNIFELYNRLKNHTYRQRPFVEFNICERGKLRHIKSLHISDRVLQRALCDSVLTPAISKYLIYDNGASIKGKGIDFTRRRLKAHLEKYYRRYGNEGYVLKIDFSKYFDNIDHAQLSRMFRKYIHDEEVIALIEYLIATNNTPDNPGRGVGIGAQLSQIAGIMYPTEIDNYCKIVRGCKYYGRYMDDTYIIHPDKNALIEILQEIRTISGRLGIVINEKKTQIIKLKNGFIFLKMRYRFTTSGRVVITPVKATITRERRKLRKLKARLDNGLITKAEIEAQYKSWRGTLEKYDTYRRLRATDALYRELFKG